MTTATPLPSVDAPVVKRIADEDPSHFSAYETCLEYERKHAASQNRLRSIRILGFLLLHAPNRDVRSEVSVCIHSRKDSSDPTDLGAFFECNVILPFKKYRGRTPKPSEHPSRPSFEDVKAEIKVDTTQAPRDHRNAKYHVGYNVVRRPSFSPLALEQALIRDNWRCAVTGAIDVRVPEDIAQLEQITFALNTECAHIIPEATFFNVEPKTEEDSNLDYSASILAVLKRFRYDINKFNGPKVHSLINVITLQHDVHDMFDELGLYFEATPQENCYEVKWFGRQPTERIHRFVTFATPDPIRLPVPAPELLALHATCCKVAYFSGAAKHIDKIYRDADEGGILSPDGASGDILRYKLLSLLKPVDVE